MPLRGKTWVVLQMAISHQLFLSLIHLLSPTKEKSSHICAHNDHESFKSSKYFTSERAPLWVPIYHSLSHHSLLLVPLPRGSKHISCLHPMSSPTTLIQAFPRWGWYTCLSLMKTCSQGSQNQFEQSGISILYQSELVPIHGIIRYRTIISINYVQIYGSDTPQ